MLSGDNMSSRASRRGARGRDLQKKRRAAGRARGPRNATTIPAKNESKRKMKASRNRRGAPRLVTSPTRSSAVSGTRGSFVCFDAIRFTTSFERVSTFTAVVVSCARGESRTRGSVSRGVSTRNERREKKRPPSRLGTLSSTAKIRVLTARPFGRHSGKRNHREIVHQRVPSS